MIRSLFNSLAQLHSAWYALINFVVLIAFPILFVLGDAKESPFLFTGILLIGCGIGTGAVSIIFNSPTEDKPLNRVRYKKILSKCITWPMLFSVIGHCGFALFALGFNFVNVSTAIILYETRQLLLSCMLALLFTSKHKEMQTWSRFFGKIFLVPREVTEERRQPRSRFAELDRRTQPGFFRAIFYLPAIAGIVFVMLSHNDTSNPMLAIKAVFVNPGTLLEGILFEGTLVGGTFLGVFCVLIAAVCWVLQRICTRKISQDFADEHWDHEVKKIGESNKLDDKRIAKVNDQISKDVGDVERMMSSISLVFGGGFLCVIGSFAVESNVSSNQLFYSIMGAFVYSIGAVAVESLRRYLLAAHFWKRENEKENLKRIGIQNIRARIIKPLIAEMHHLPPAPDYNHLIIEYNQLIRENTRLQTIRAELQTQHNESEEKRIQLVTEYEQLKTEGERERINEEIIHLDGELKQIGLIDYEMNKIANQLKEVQLRMTVAHIENAYAAEENNKKSRGDFDVKAVLAMQPLQYATPLGILILLWMFTILEVSHLDYLIIGAMGITVSNLLVRKISSEYNMQEYNMEKEQKRWSSLTDLDLAHKRNAYQALMASLWLFGTITYFTPGFVTDVPLELPVTIFILVLAFRVARLVRRTSQEEEWVIEIFQKIKFISAKKLRSDDLVSKVALNEASKSLLLIDQHKSEDELVRAYTDMFWNLNQVQEADEISDEITDIRRLVDMLVHSRQQGSRFDEIVAISMAAFLLVLGLLFFNGGREFYGELTSILLSSVVVFLLVNILDLERDRSDLTLREYSDVLSVDFSQLAGERTRDQLNKLGKSLSPYSHLLEVNISCLTDDRTKGEMVQSAEFKEFRASLDVDKNREIEIIWVVISLVIIVLFCLLLTGVFKPL